MLEWLRELEFIAPRPQTVHIRAINERNNFEGTLCVLLKMLCSWASIARDGILIKTCTKRVG